MTHVLVVTGPLERGASQVLLQERLATELLDSEHYSRQLLERMRWAVEDAERAEATSETDPARSAGSRARIV